MDLGLAGKTAIVTGGASGLGLTTCEQLVARGARVVAFDLNEEAGKALADKLGAQALFTKVDVTDSASVEQGIARTIEAFGAIHICIKYI